MPDSTIAAADRATFLKLWDESWSQGIWVTPWSKALETLSAAQAAWKPDPARHSIWQIVNHMCVWREYTLTRIDGRAGPRTEGMSAINFQEAISPTADAWKATLARFKRTHDDLRAAVAVPGASMERAMYHLGHDCYHLGQIMYLRAMQGLPPVE